MALCVSIIQGVCQLSKKTKGKDRDHRRIDLRYDVFCHNCDHVNYHLSQNCNFDNFELCDGLHLCVYVI